MSSVTCCAAMKEAIDLGYFYTPIVQYEFEQDGKRGVGLRVSSPLVEGPKLTSRGRKRKPHLILSFCPMCGKPFDTSEYGGEGKAE